MTTRLLTCAIALLNCCLVLGDTPKAELPLLIEEQPIGRVVSAGGHVTLSVMVTGAPPIIYQWWKGTQPLAGNVRITGVTSRVLNIDPVQTTDTSNYFVVVTSPSLSVTSSVASVEVSALPRAATVVGTNVIINVLGPVGDVYRIESSPDFFSPSITNGYATNRTGVAEYIEPNLGSQRFYQARFQRMLPVLYSPTPLDTQTMVRAYGKLNEQWRFEGTTNFLQWTNLGTVTNTNGWVKFKDTNAAPGQRFYRITPP
ncbi:MAG TPA: immunoglobulin domain-containing protein [Candidatus Acidoferrum sp.]|nr:immunoglobulin domain-containing protein [Candidatus Acidoferrum sp.]